MVPRISGEVAILSVHLIPQPRLRLKQRWDGALARLDEAHTKFR
jgi:hypothetical protein